MTIAPSDAPPASYETRFTRLVGCRLPIQSAPMAGVVSDAELPAAVAAAGGHGMFPALFLSAPYLTRVISDLSGRTRAYGVNFIGLMLDRECLEIAAGHAPLVELFLAEPSREIVDTIHAGGALASYQVASDQQALRAQDAGADLLVVQGIEAGGHARTVVELGAATRRAGRRAEARDLLRPGMELAHACGARALVARAREELLATGARPRRIVRTGADALTASERRVARMAAEGMTNREIAQALFVTMRTVEVHLTHAYQKLGVSSREKLPVALGLAGP